MTTATTTTPTLERIGDSTRLALAPAPPRDVQSDTAQRLPPSPPSALVEVSDAPWPNTTPAPTVGDVIRGYRIDAPLFADDLGAVYAAFDTRRSRRAVLRIVRRELCASDVRVLRFVAQVRAVDAIRHPDIAEVYGCGELVDGRGYIITEPFQGRRLRERIDASSLTIAEFAAILRPLCYALDAAHDRGIVHRDLRPDHVLVASDGPRRRIKLVGFGLAELLGLESRCASYAAPELVRGRAIDGAADVYALGAIAFEMLTGKPPFVADHAIDVIAQHLLEPAPRPSAFAGGVPRQLDDVVHAMLAKDAGDRPTLATLHATLDGLFATRPFAAVKAR
jgi:serine/threonine-protein kinase